MSILREIPPTAGFPIYAKDLLSLLSGKNCAGSLEGDFRNFLGAPYAKVTYSGTAAFYIILETIKKLSKRKTVIIPSFVCPLVPLAIKRAGLKTAVCDINANDFGFDMAKLQKLCADNRDILAIVPVHLGGIPVDLDAIQKICAGKDIFIVEDCAQSLGAQYNDSKIGTLGDFSFYSLCRGKGLTIYEGGVLVTRSNEYAPILNETIRQFVKNDRLSETLKIAELWAYWAFYRPSLFWFAFKLPQNYWNYFRRPERAAGEYFDLNFPLHKVSGIRRSLGHITFGRLEPEIEKQRQKAQYYIQGLKDSAGIRSVTERGSSKATYPYLTIVFDDETRCANAKETLINSGLGVSLVYLCAIADYAYLKLSADQDCTNARRLAKTHMTLSTSAFIGTPDQDAVIRKLKGLKT